VKYKSILLGIDIDAPSTSLIKLAVELAKRFDARLIGCASADVVLPIMTGDGDDVDRGFVERQRKTIESRLEYLQKQFIELAGSSVEIEWREGVANPTDFITQAARVADLIITGSPEGPRADDPFRSINIGNLMLKAGRPVLLAADGAEHLLGKKVLVAWKDGREARRAVVDAMPFLAGANEILVVTIERKETEAAKQSLADLIAFLAHHGVRAKAVHLTGKSEADDLLKFARSVHTDLIVSGAYGHSRLREWVFGGVTNSMLDEMRISRFLSH
jgi:nucleotide-binding universal stress UspA family protein